MKDVEPIKFLPSEKANECRDCGAAPELVEVNGVRKAVRCSDPRCKSHDFDAVYSRRCEAILAWNLGRAPRTAYRSL